MNIHTKNMDIGHVISRPWFCESCYKAGRPHVGDYYVLYGSTNKLLTVYRFTDRRSRKLRGIVPHLITLDKVHEFMVEIIVSCGIHKCGIQVFPSETDTTTVDVLKTDTFLLLNEDWNALLNRRFFSYYL